MIGRMPLSHIIKNGVDLNRKEMSKEELSEVRLRAEWGKSALRKALIACTGISLDELPEQYAQYKEQIATLREYGLGLKEESVFDQIIDWLETHDGNMPRSIISKGGKQAKRVEMTEAEIYEVNLYYNWLRSGEREAIEECRRNTNR